jgi:protein SCO1/2
MKYLPLILMVLLLAACQKTTQHGELVCCAPPAAVETSAAAAPGATSLYQMPGTWQTAQGGELPLDSLQGKVRVFSMIFTHCAYACPRTVDNMKEIASRLPAGVRDRVGFVLVTFDTARDSTARLREFAAAKGLDGHFTLLRGSDTEVRMLSALLNVQYARLATGDYSHSNVMVVLDENGEIATRIEGLDVDAQAAAGKIAAVVR